MSANLQPAKKNKKTIAYANQQDMDQDANANNKNRHI